ncbi:MAG: hypothetical protein HQL66_05470 [Magnetococcales bacterium]|nr:hypothetical protein [Magnetococcales bacterium]
MVDLPGEPFREGQFQIETAARLATRERRGRHVLVRRGANKAVDEVAA